MKEIRKHTKFYRFLKESHIYKAFMRGETSMVLYVYNFDALKNLINAVKEMGVIACEFDFDNDYNIRDAFSDYKCVALSLFKQKGEENIFLIFLQWMRNNPTFRCEPLHLINGVEYRLQTHL